MTRPILQQQQLKMWKFCRLPGTASVEVSASVVGSSCNDSVTDYTLDTSENEISMRVGNRHDQDKVVKQALTQS